MPLHYTLRRTRLCGRSIMTGFSSLFQNGSEDLIVVGAGGAAAEALWLVEAINHAALSSGRPFVWNILGCCVYDPSFYPVDIMSYSVLGTPQSVAKDRGQEPLYFVCAIGDNKIR